MEAAGLVIGVVPIVVEAVKSYRTAYKAIQNIRHCPREVVLVQRVLEAHRAVFENECRLLWILAVRDLPSADALLEQDVLDSTTLAEVELRFKSVLAENYQPCWSLVEIIRERLRHIEQDLTTFARVKGEQDKIALRDQARHIRNAFTLAFRKTEYLQKLDQIKAYLETLKNLRTSVESIRLQRTFGTSRKTPAEQIIPPQFQAIRGANSKLHEALTEAWQTTCSNTSHIGHETILFLNTKVNKRVSSDIAISSKRELGTFNEQSSIYEPPIWLRVCSSLIDGNQRFHIQDHGIVLPNDCPTISSTIGTTLSRQRFLTLQSKQWDEDNKSQRKSLISDGRPSKSKHRWYHLSKSKLAEESSRSGETNDEPSNFVALATTSYSVKLENELRSEPETGAEESGNLCQRGGICNRLQQLIKGRSGEERCVGYLESPGSYKHSIYTTVQPDADDTTLRMPISLVELLRSATDESMEVPDQLKIAHKLAVALLRFESTPWLPSYWEIGHFHLFRSVANVLDSALDTLHLSAHFPTANPIARSAEQSHVSEAKPEPEADIVSRSTSDYQIRVSSAQSLVDTTTYSRPTAAEVEADPDPLLYGINNMTLCSLGIALSAIGHRKPLQDLKLENEPNHIITARRLSNGPMRLGRKYQEIIRKCLWCDFSAGFRLEKTKLQSAVYSEVVLTLEDMMKSLTI